MAELVKCNKATRKCREETKYHGACPHAIFHFPEKDYNHKGKLLYCTEGDLCSTPYGNPSGGVIKMRCMTKEDLKAWPVEAKKFRKEVDKLSKKYKITLEELL